MGPRNIREVIFTFYRSASRANSPTTRASRQSGTRTPEFSQDKHLRLLKTGLLGQRGFPVMMMIALLVMMLVFDDLRNFTARFSAGTSL